MAVRCACVRVAPPRPLRRAGKGVIRPLPGPARLGEHAGEAGRRPVPKDRDTIMSGYLPRRRAHLSTAARRRRLIAAQAVVTGGLLAWAAAAMFPGPRGSAAGPLPPPGDASARPVLATAAPGCMATFQAAVAQPGSVFRRRWPRRNLAGIRARPVRGVVRGVSCSGGGGGPADGPRPADEQDGGRRDQGGADGDQGNLPARHAADSDHADSCGRTRRGNDGPV
jgi:hypothetical protein